MEIRDILSLLQEACKPQLTEMPVLVGDEDFALSDPAINRYEYRRLMGLKNKILWRRQHFTVRETSNGSIDNEIFLADEVDQKLLFVVNFDVEETPALGKFATQRVLWRSPQLGVFKNIAKRVFFDVLLNRYGAVVSDMTHTQAGKSFWMSCLKEAVFQGLTVGIIDTATGAATVLPDGEEVDEWFRDRHPWSPDETHAEIRLFISKKALKEDFSVAPRETLGTKVTAYTSTAFQKATTHPKSTGVWFTSDQELAEKSVQKGIKQLVWDPRVITAEIELGNVKHYNSYQEFMADYRKAGSDGAWYRRMLRRDRYHSIEISGENGAKIWAVMGNWQIKIKEVKKLTEDSDMVVEGEDGFTGEVSRLVSKIKTFAKRYGVSIEIEPMRNAGPSAILVTDFEAAEKGQGAGSKVMRKLAEIADDAWVSVYLMPDTARNKEFYERFGFEVSNRFVGYMARHPAAPSWMR